MIKKLFTTVRKTVSGQAAFEDVASIIRHHRIQASPGYRAAAQYVLAELHKAGIAAKARPSSGPPVPSKNGKLNQPPCIWSNQRSTRSNWPITAS
jgi:hypothetical protein